MGAWTVQICARHYDGAPVVTATRNGEMWSIGWKNGDSVGLRGISEDDARRIADELAERVALKVVPADEAAAAARREVAAWLLSQEEPADE